MDCDDKMNCAQRREKIRQCNDQVRITGTGGRTLLTRAVAALAPDILTRLFAAISAYDAFTTANDPGGEHDFGQVTLEGMAYFWKIDAYDLDLEFASIDPADETLTCRILTIMTAADL